MKIGYIGLGKMGLNMVERLSQKGHELVVFDQSTEAIAQAQSFGATSAASAVDAVKKLSTPRTIWIMVPHTVVGDVIDEIRPELSEGDTIIDGGNSHYKKSVARAKNLAEKKIHFLDAGVSGGPSGAKNGACVMIGGDTGVYEKHKPLFEDIAAPDAYAHFGRAGAGHFVKMVHNGIEYGMMQAIGEGFAVMKESDFDLDLHEVARVYNHKSVIESRLIGWLKRAYESCGEDLESISGKVSHSGEGLWTVEAAKELGIPVAIIEGALQFRENSQKNPSYTGKVVSALRNQFGGHHVKEK